MSPLHPELRRRLRAGGPLNVPPPPPGLASRVLALARSRVRAGDGADAEVAPEPFLMAAAGLAMAVAVAGLVFWNLPGQATSPAPDFIEATQFAFTQLLP